MSHSDISSWGGLGGREGKKRQFSSLGGRQEGGSARHYATGCGSPSLFWKRSAKVLLSDRRNRGRFDWIETRGWQWGRRLSCSSALSAAVQVRRIKRGDGGIILKLGCELWLNKLCQLGEQKSGTPSALHPSSPKNFPFRETHEARWQRLLCFLLGFFSFGEEVGFVFFLLRRSVLQK